MLVRERGIVNLVAALGGFSLVEMPHKLPPNE